MNYYLIMNNKIVKKNKWEPSEDDAFQIETKDFDYYYAIVSRLNGLGDHWYKINKKTNEMEEVSQDEIVDIIQNYPEQVLSKCSCIRIISGRLQPLVIDPR